MLNIRFILKMLGRMFLLETLFMLAATGVAFLYGENDRFPFLISSGLMAATGFLFCALGFRAKEKAAGRREGMLIVSLIWGLFSLYGMLPFLLGGYIDNITDAFFETMSGFTTTGSSILTDIERLPHGILFWRSLTQWQGGIGMVVFTVALLPIFGGVSSQMFDAETTGTGISQERFLPRITQVAKRLWGLYLFLTFVVIGLLWLGPMNLFDAVNHGLATISTGGYSTKNSSIGFWHSAYVEYVVTLFMFIGATNMTLIYFSLNGRVKKLLQDEEFRWYVGLVSLAIIATGLWIYHLGFSNGWEETFRKSAFQVVTLVTTCGFATDNFVPWGPFFWVVALILMFICGCAGSTGGGLKMVRAVVLTKILSNEFKKQTHPQAVIPVRINGHVVSADVVHRVLAFVFAYITLIVFSCLVLTLDGLGFIEAISAAITAISNVGPGLGAIGPANTFVDLPDTTKWFLAFLMMVGRLEIFTVLTILMPGFWKQ